METDFSGSYVNEDNVKDSDIFEIVGEGSMEAKISLKGIKYQQMNIEISNNSKQLIYSLPRDTGKAFQRAWGTDSKNWIGKKARAKHVHFLSYGQTKKRIEAEPITETKQ